MNDKEIKVQDLCSDRDRKVILTLSVIIAGLIWMVFILGLLYLAALFT